MTTKTKEGAFDPSTCQELTKEEYLVGVTNSIGTMYPELRSRSKAPTFRSTISWDRIYSP